MGALSTAMFRATSGPKLFTATRDRWRPGVLAGAALILLGQEASARSSTTNSRSGVRGRPKRGSPCGKGRRSPVTA